jgi:hypothetical protein
MRMAGVRFALGVHAHQSVGNFPEVFSEAYRRSYVPFLDVLSEFPQTSKRRFGVTARGMRLAERVPQQICLLPAWPLGGPAEGTKPRLTLEVETRKDLSA